MLTEGIAYFSKKLSNAERNYSTTEKELAGGLKYAIPSNVTGLKPYKEGGTVQPPPLPEIIEGEKEYEVEAVLAHRERKLRGRKTAREYLVKWTGYEDIHNTWEPEDNLEHAREALQRYWDLTTEHRPEQKEKVDKKRKGRGKNAQKQRKRARRA
eukprot:jgi/Botrbrau1/8256/Bobra.0001s0014.1